jgi:uncharacterized protein YeeX (DUF496 family)
MPVKICTPEEVLMELEQCGIKLRAMKKRIEELRELLEFAWITRNQVAICDIAKKIETAKEDAKKVIETGEVLINFMFSKDAGEIE